MDTYDEHSAPINGNQGEEQQEIKKHTKKKLTSGEKMQLKLKRERDFKLLEMRNQLRREYELSKNTARKYREHWEEMCREVKLKQMRQELQDWEKQVNRVMQQKDDKIKLLLDEMATTEDIHSKSFSAHLQMMDYLTDILKTFQESSYLLYEQQASELLRDFYREVEMRNTHANQVKVNCESVAHATEVLAEHELLRDYKIFVEKRDDRVNDEIEKRYRLRDKILKQMKYLQEQLVEFVNSLMNTSVDAQKYETINSLMERQKYFQIESLRLDKVEERTTRVCKDLQSELEKEQKEFKSKLHVLKVESAYFAHMRKEMEDEMKLNHEETYEMLKVVTSGSYDVKKDKILRIIQWAAHTEWQLNSSGNRKFLVIGKLLEIAPSQWGDFLRLAKQLKFSYHNHLILQRKFWTAEYEQNLTNRRKSNKYQKLQKYGELLLSLAASCGKYQTESEKVVPYGDLEEPKIDNESFKLKVLDLKKLVDTSEEELQKTAHLMSNFYRRQALAEAQVVLLEERKKNLLKENQNYIAKIRLLSKTNNAEDLLETIKIKPAEQNRD